MEQANVYEPYFIPEFAHLEQPVREAQSQIIYIDNELAVLKERGWRFDLQPPGTPNRSEAIGQRREYLITTKTSIKTTLNERVEHSLKNVDPVKAKRVRETVEILTGENRYRAMNKDQMNSVKSNQRNINTSAEYMSKSLVRERAKTGYSQAAERYFNSLPSANPQSNGPAPSQQSKAIESGKEGTSSAPSLPPQQVIGKEPGED